jgi:heme exporter protein D
MYRGCARFGQAESLNSEFMPWSSLSQFISMGGYGLYVWGSYGITLVLLGGEVIMLLKRKRDLSKRASSPQLETKTPELEIL